MATGFPIIFGGRRQAWTPAQISTALWLDAADASTITLNGSTVSQWDDKSGNGRNFAQVTAASQPTFLATGLNNKPLLSFDGSNDVLTYSGTLATNGATAILVANLSSTVAFNRGVLVFTDGTNWDYLPGSFLVWATGFDGVSGNSGADAYYNGLAAGTQNATFTMDANMIYGYTSTQGIYGNGSLLHSGNNGTASINLTSGAIGSRLQGTATSNFSKVSVSEILLTNTPMDETTRQRAEGYLAWKWGLESNLPANHPYKNSPPTV